MFPYISVFGRNIGTYGLCMILGFALAGFLAYRCGKPIGLRWEDLLIIAAMVLGGALLGGGGLYVFITYSWNQIIEFIHQGDFRFLGSGIVFYGGLIGGVLGALLGIRVAACPFRIAEYAIVPFIPLGHAIGRIGCVLAGCCHGFAYDGPLALYYPHSLAGVSPQQGYFPVQPLESLVNITICLLLLHVQKHIRRIGDLLFAYLGMYAVSRFFLEMLRGDSIRGLWDGISTSQWISLTLLGMCLLRLVGVVLHEKM